MISAFPFYSVFSHKSSSKLHLQGTSLSCNATLVINLHRGYLPIKLSDWTAGVRGVPYVGNTPNYIYLAKTYTNTSV